jgi:adenylate kinase family enzyme
MKKLLASIVWRFRGVKVYALVGKSGTGKSFRARLLVDKYNIDLIVDDGLLIRDKKIIAGKSAKREKAYLSAVKTALFTDKEHRKQVRHVLEHEHFKRILIIGTSQRMVEKIASALQLPPPAKIIRIDEIATAEEIDTAIHYRRSQGGHVIPVPSIEVKRNYPQFMADSIKVLLSKGFGVLRRQNVYEKSVVRPVFSSRGSVTISEAALSQMIMHCVDEYSPGLQIRKVQVRNEKHGYKLNVFVQVPYGKQLAGTIHGLQTYVVENLEKYTGIMIDEVNIVVDSVAEEPAR